MLSELIEQWGIRVHRILDELEDPEAVLDDSLRAQAELLAEIRKDLRDIIADELQTRDELDRSRQAKREWGDKATEALSAGREDLAREALTKEIELELVVRDLEKIYYQRKEDAQLLKTVVEKMAKDHENLDRGKALLLARMSLAELNKNLVELRATYEIDPMGGSNARMRARAGTVDSEEQRRITENELELEFVALEANEKVQAKLAEMKKETPGGN